MHTTFDKAALPAPVAIAKSLRELEALFRPPKSENASLAMTGADTTLLTSKPKAEKML